MLRSRRYPAVRSNRSGLPTNRDFPNRPGAPRPLGRIVGHKAGQAGTAQLLSTLREPTPAGAHQLPARRRGLTLSCMNFLFALTHQTGRQLAQVGFLLVLLAGVWLAAAHIPQLKLGTARTIIAGIALAIAGLLLMMRPGNFGQIGVVPRHRPRVAMCDGQCPSGGGKPDAPGRSRGYL